MPDNRMSVADEAEKLPYGWHSEVPGLKRDDEWRRFRVYEPTCASGRRAIV